MDAEGILWVACYASDEIWKVEPDGQKILVASDPWSWKLSGPAALAFGGPENADLYVCNASRTHVSRLRVGCKGLAPINRRRARKFRPRPAPL
jgi:sugar lactone lactonase YvrE